MKKIHVLAVALIIGVAAVFGVLSWMMAKGKFGPVE